MTDNMLIGFGIGFLICGVICFGFLLLKLYEDHVNEVCDSGGGYKGSRPGSGGMMRM